MSKSFYIFQNCRISRKDNNILISLDKEIKNIKSEIVEDIYIFGEVDFNTKFLNFISQKKISLHIYNYYGYYSGSYIPKDTNVNGKILIKQVESYLDIEKRLNISKEILLGGSYNILRNLKYYNRRGKNLEKAIKSISILREKLKTSNSINQLMGYEGNIRKIYYSSWSIIIDQEIDFEKRVKRPPDNMINSLISFINSIIYTVVLAEIYKTQLNPTISYLHEPGSKRFPLSLDISEIFKPLIVDRLIFKLLNKNIVGKNSFEKDSNYVYLKDKDRKKIIIEINNSLDSTIKHKELDRSVSYRYLIRLEGYKIIKDLIGEKEYESFKIWW